MIGEVRGMFETVTLDHTVTVVVESDMASNTQLDNVCNAVADAMLLAGLHVRRVSPRVFAGYTDGQHRDKLDLLDEALRDALGRLGGELAFDHGVYFRGVISACHVVEWNEEDDEGESRSLGSVMVRLDADSEHY